MKNKFYVYVFLREDFYSPYYVGKGQGKRCYEKGGRNCNRPPKDRIRKVFFTNDEDKALAVERTLIKFWGRKLDGGVLQNISEGGNQPPNLKGKKFSAERRKLMSETAKRLNLARFMRGAGGGAKPGNKNSWGHRREITLDGITYPSVSHAARALGTSRQNIINWASGRFKRTR